MFELDRTKKFSAVLFVIAAVSFVLAGIAFMRGGAELFFSDADGGMYMPREAVRMTGFLCVSLLSLLGGIGLRKVNRDVAELLRYLSEREENKKQ